MKDEDGNEVGIPLFTKIFIYAISTGVAGVFSKDLMFVMFILALFVIIIVTLDCIIGNKIPRRKKIFKRASEGDILIPVHCTKYYLGSHRVCIETEEGVLAKIVRGKTTMLPFKPGPNRILIYRNKHDKTEKIINIKQDLEVYAWFNHGELNPTSIIEMRKGDPIPEAKSKESYVGMRNVAVPLSAITIALCLFFIAWALHHLNII